MKLLLCTSCSEIFNLAKEEKSCSRGCSGGKYIDNINAHIWGPWDSTFCLGFANSSFIGALRNQKLLGDSEERFSYIGKDVAKGREFTAFVIPDSAESVRWFATKEEADRALTGTNQPEKPLEIHRISSRTDNSSVQVFNLDSGARNHGLFSAGTFSQVLDNGRLWQCRRSP